MLELRNKELLRDPSAWYHFVLKVDTTQSNCTMIDIKIYINGIEQTSTHTRTYLSIKILALNFGHGTQMLHRSIERWRGIK